MIKRIIFFLVILGLFLPGFVMANDFGVVLNQYAETTNSASEDTSFEYDALLIPRALFLFGEPSSPSGALFVSAGLKLEYKDDLQFIPELLRTEFFMQRHGLGLRLGRFGYATPLPLLADGLFDGVQVSYSSSLGRFRAGAWYTGLLYKDRANIDITGNDRHINETELDYSKFSETYFAPARLLTSIDYEHFAIADILRLNANFTAQTDLSDKSGKFHSQYLTLKAGLPVYGFFFEAGGIVSTFQAEGNDDFKLGYAGEFGISRALPTGFPSRIFLFGQYASGRSDGVGAAFVPITKNGASDIFDARIAALTTLGLNYTARFVETLGSNLSFKYFMRNDLSTYNTFPIEGEGEHEHLLGAEIFAKFIWSPVSDIAVNLGAGAFLPALGNNWKDTGPVWLVNLTAIVTLY